MAELIPEAVIFEMILTTVDAEGKPNAAPVGVTRKGSDLHIELASGTRSLRNLRDSRMATLSIVYDARVFAKTAFNMTPADAFCTRRGWRVPVIAGAASSILVSLASHRATARKDELGRTVFHRLTLRPVQAVIPGLPRPHSRRFAAAIEVIISVTRARVAAERGLHQPVAQISRTVEEKLELARRTGHDPETEEALQICVRELASITNRVGRGQDVQ